MSKFSTFYEWLAKQKGRKSPLGDLASEVSRDASFPKELTTLDALVTYMKAKKASGQAIATARIAWQTYTRSSE